MKTIAKRANYWIIDKDLGCDSEGEHSAVGTMGPRGCPDNDKALTLRFRLSCDGDSEGEREIVYLGRMVPFDQHDEDSDGFEPLDNFGAPNYGCTGLEYWEPGKGGGWKTL